jgi:hypothetical protein
MSRRGTPFVPQCGEVRPDNPALATPGNRHARPHFSFGVETNTESRLIPLSSLGGPIAPTLATVPHVLG